MKNPQKILFLADINSTHTELWVKGLLGRGFKIALFSLSKSVITWADDLENFEYHCFGIEVNEVKSNRRFGKFSYFTALTEARNYAESIAPDIVHAHYASSYGTLARRVGHPKTVLSLWGSDVYQFPKRSPFHRLLFKRAVRFAKVVCSTSVDMAREAKKYVDREIIITPFGVDMDLFVPAQIGTMNEMTTIGTAKSLEDVYGIDRLIDLFAEFNSKVNFPVQLQIYGEGTKKDELIAQTQRLGIEELVTFNGFIRGDDLIRAFQSFNVFVTLSRRESFGVSTLEAQACGVPALVTNVGGLPEVTSPETGIIVDENSPETWCDSLLELVGKSRDPYTIELTRQFVQDNFSHEVCVDKLIEVYRNV
ncbi:MAG: glycosyltransferase [Crocinitomicaceae bacterium]|nr:glycosyltransferase [Flavobacteriales bacterium]NQZ34541.1 glycosyltransferase [Crocinitomicaceae bacterium]